MGTLQEQALAGTMREEFEADWRTHDRHPEALSRGDDGEYNYFDVRMGWKTWQAAYAAGQRAEREACATVCDELAELNRRASTDSMWQQGECAAAIRNRKEQG